jgi:ABC-type multidrug transport system ATPase subunit
LVDLKQQGKAILISTHLLEDIEQIADEFILLHQGEIYLSGSMETYRMDKQNVTFHFEEHLPEEISKEWECTIKGHTLQLSASIPKTKEVLSDLYKKGLIPYKIERSSVLYDKYMEIAK